MVDIVETEIVETRAPQSVATPVAYMRWGPVIAGALTAAALASVLHSFGAALGFALGSSAPTWRDASVALWIASGLYLILVALVTYGIGGYIAGRMRSGASAAVPDEVEFRDGLHGLLVWALATLLTGVLAFAAVPSLTRVAAPAASSTGAAQSVGGENVIAYELDRLFRSERRPADAENTQARAEAGRILLTASGHDGVAADDRTYLARLVESRTGLSRADAERRTSDVIARAETSLDRAHRSAVIVAFMAGAAALLGSAAAWFAACAGGRHRDGAPAPSMWWDLRRSIGGARAGT